MDRREQRRQEEELLRQRRQQQLAALEAQRAQAAVTGTTVGVPQVQGPPVSQVPSAAQPESERASFIRRATLASNAENVYDIMQNYTPRDQVYMKDQVYTKDQITKATVWCADGSMNCELPKDRFGLSLTGDQVINIGSSQIFQTSGNLVLNSQVGIPGRNTIEFGIGVDGKEKQAGKIGYGTFDNGASLALVGAGTKSGSRNVRVWDNLLVANDQTVSRNANVVGDLSFTGVNGWTIHTPDDTRRSMFIAPRTTDNKNWNWGRQLILENNGNMIIGGEKLRLLNAGHATNSNNFSMEIVAPSTTNTLETSLRFHQGGKYWNQIRSDGNGFRFTTGDKADLVPIQAGNISSNGNLRVNGTLCLGTSGSTCLTENDLRSLLALIKR